MHPGGIRTGLQTDVEPWLAFKWALVSPFFAKTVPQGAATTVFCATAPLGVPGAPVPGAYHEDCNASKIAPAFDALLGDAAVTRRFWDASEALVRKALAVAPEAPAGSCGCPHEPMAIDA